MYIFILIPVISAVTSLAVIKSMSPRLEERSITGQDVHKLDRPELPEMVGIAITSGFLAGMLTVIGFNQFAGCLICIDLMFVLAAGLTVTIAALIGMVDDLLRIPKSIKAVTPLAAALPLVVLKAEYSSMVLPLIGEVEMGLVYPFLFVPAAVTVTTNAVNMVAGYNGLEAGMGVIIMSSLAFIAWSIGSWTAFCILICGLGATVVCLYYNWFPADIFIGDTGTFTIGAISASAVIIGNFEYGLVILLIPFGLDFLLKAPQGFPKSFARNDEGKLYSTGNFPAGIAQMVLKVTGGLHEKILVIVLLGIEAVFAVLAVLYYI